MTVMTALAKDMSIGPVFIYKGAKDIDTHDTQMKKILQHIYTKYFSKTAVITVTFA